MTYIEVSGELGISYTPIHPDIKTDRWQINIAHVHLNAKGGFAMGDTCYVEIRRASGWYWKGHQRHYIAWGFGQCPHGATAIIEPEEWDE